jgi:hypothetical protein
MKKVRIIMFNKVNEIWDYIVDNSIASEEALTLITNINGYSVDTLNDVIYAMTGYRSMEQLEGEDNDD